MLHAFGIISQVEQFNEIQEKIFRYVHESNSVYEYGINTGRYLL